jgi:hypothetical protein
VSTSHRSATGDELPPKLARLVPREKDDVKRAQQLINVGYPDNIAALPEIFSWLKDGNWPIARPAAEYLSRMSWAVLPHVRSILQSDETIWIYWVLTLVVREFPKDLLVELAPLFRRLTDYPSEAVSARARELLALLAD